MTVSRRDFLRYTSFVAAGAALGHLSTRPILAQNEIDPLLYTVNRVTWGARPADLERIQHMGSATYIDWQLDYTQIPDPLVDQFVNARRILSMDANGINRTAEQDYSVVLNLALWARLYRAIYSERQLYERMVEFWSDHLNIPIPDYLADKIVDDREVIRKHALGNFRDLILASAQSPAMLYYLDNAVSDAEHPNENYARELMELHTLGVEGGYTEQDVIELARILTGWTVRDGWGFYFDADRHDYGEKTFLGQPFPAGRGIEEGLQVLDLLALHPNTARFVCSKLCRRFVNDTPPSSLIDSAAQVFLDTQGDIRAIMRHILNSSEFMNAVGTKFRRPLEFLVAILRILSDGLQIDNPDTLIYTLEPMGQIPYFWHPPNGYPDEALAWINTNGLLHRWNTALEISLASEGYFPGVALNLPAIIPAAPTAGELVNNAVQRLLQHPLPAQDIKQLVTLVVGSDTPTQPINAAQMDTLLPPLVGVILASPYFQWI